VIEVQKDDRLLVRCAEIQEKVMKEVSRITNMDPFVWLRCVEIIGDPSLAPQDLCSDAVKSTHGSVAFMHEQIFSLVEEPPWNLFYGDVSENYEELRLSEEPEGCLVSSRIHKLAVRGWRPVDVKKALAQGQKQLKFSANMIEQDHAVGQRMHRYHHGYGVKLLASRIMIYLMRVHVRLPHPDTYEAFHKRAIARITDHKNPNKLHGHNIYLRELSQKSDAVHARETVATRQEAHRELVITHCDQWRLLSPELRDSYNRSALTEREERKVALLAKLEDHNECLSLHRQKMKFEMEDKLQPLLCSSMKFTDGDLEQLARMLDDHEMYSQTRMEEKRENSMVPIARPSVLHQRALIARPTGLPVRQRFAQWVGQVCRTREHSLGNIMQFQYDPTREPVAFQIVRVCKQPYQVSLLPLELLPHPPLAPSGYEVNELSEDRHTFDYVYRVGTYVKSCKIPITPDMFFYLD